ncbi:MAG: cytochrome c-type biogenesis protein CcmH [Halobacteria archaeon]|nr:cytochrome c-type biogenesis protein CcmH [Halobacteria archaeon]
MKKLILLLLFSGLGTAFAGVEVHQFEQAEQEQQYNRLIAELRCLVCQNQNLADSNAELAQDLRQEVYEMIQNGASDQEIINFMVARYGDFVLYRPPFKTTTAFLWVGPFIILIAGFVILLMFIRKRRQLGAVELDESEHARARELLNQNNETDSQ